MDLMEMLKMGILLWENGNKKREIMIMKTSTKILSLLAAVAVVFAGCSDDDIIKKNEVIPAKPGDKISFGGVVNFDDANASRTVYGDRLEGYTEIKWYSGDQVRIYCAQAENEAGESHTSCDYSVVNPVSNPYGDEDKDGNDYEQFHQTGLTPVEGYAELCWGENTTHEFYGVYPAYGQLNTTEDVESQGAAGRLELTGNKLTGFLPNKQVPLGHTKYTTSTFKTTIDNAEVERTHYVLQPAMRYAYMVAKATTEPVSTVSMTFKPVVTAVEVTLINNSTAKVLDANGNVTSETPQDITGLELLSITSDDVVCGAFSTTIDGSTNATNPTTTTTTTEAEAYKTISIPVDIENKDLKYGDKITFTAFMILDDDSDGLDNFSVGVYAANTTKMADLSGKDGGIIVQVKKKNFIKNVPLDLGSTSTLMTPANWIEYIPNQINGVDNTIGNLSIPGAGGASSGSMTTDIETSAQQTLTIEGLWNQGVRCFEFGVDRSDDFTNEIVYCNLIPTNKSINEAVNEVVGLLAEHPEEFAVVIVAYQEKDISSWTRQSGASGGFAEDFNGWWASFTMPTQNKDGETISLKKGVYSSSMTMENARGNLFMICRPTAMGLDGGWYTGANNLSYNSTTGPYLPILGWGTHPDQWYARGYGNIRTKALETSWGSVISEQRWVNYDFSYSEARPYYVDKSAKPNAPASSPLKTTGLFEFGMPTTIGSITYDNLSKQETAYIQEWRRVMPTAALQSQFKLTDIPTTSTNGGSGSAYFYNWAPSSEQKWNDVVTALDEAMSKEGGYGLYINSLCGYFIDGKIKESYQPLVTLQLFGVSSVGLLYTSGYAVDDKYHTSDWVDMNASYVGGLFTDYPNRNGDWGPYVFNGGYKGNIGAFAQWINNRFYNYLLTLQADGTLDGTKGTGIIMMDRVSDNASTNAAGYYIPRIIMSNNQFSETTATANGLSLQVVNSEVSEARSR